MATKIKSVWYCTSCGNESPKWMGRCPACGEWNTMVEEPKAPKGAGGGAGSRGGAAASRSRAFLDASDARPTRLREIDLSRDNRFSVGIEELDRVLGGGLVEGSMVLIGGEPGIGKSTLSLQIPLCCKNLRTLYVSGEESQGNYIVEFENGILTISYRDKAATRKAETEFDNITFARLAVRL